MDEIPVESEILSEINKKSYSYPFFIELKGRYVKCEVNAVNVSDLQNVSDNSCCFCRVSILNAETWTSIGQDGSVRVAGRHASDTYRILTATFETLKPWLKKRGMNRARVRKKRQVRNWIHFFLVVQHCALL